MRSNKQSLLEKHFPIGEVTRIFNVVNNVREHLHYLSQAVEEERRKKKNSIGSLLWQKKLFQHFHAIFKTSDHVERFIDFWC